MVGGAAGGIRTRDRRLSRDFGLRVPVTRPALYRLSYGGLPFRVWYFIVLARVLLVSVLFLRLLSFF